jgi:hypothetical protein
MQAMFKHERNPLAYYDIAGVAGIEDARRAAIQSLSFDARFRIMDRTQAPFGLTLSVSPHWGLVEETSGVRYGNATPCRPRAYA